MAWHPRPFILTLYSVPLLILFSLLGTSILPFWGLWILVYIQRIGSSKESFLILHRQNCVSWNLIHSIITAFRPSREMRCRQMVALDLMRALGKQYLLLTHFTFPKSVQSRDLFLNEWKTEWMNELDFFILWSCQATIHVVSPYFYLCALELLGIPVVMSLASVHSFIKIKQASCQTWL